MATCPKCGEFLDDNHHCTSRWFRVASGVVITLTGAVLGIWIVDHLVRQTSTLFATLGALVGGGVFLTVWGTARSKRHKRKPRPVIAAVGESPSSHPAVSPAPLRPAKPGAPAEPVLASAYGALNILVVDDEGPVRALLLRWIEPFGFPVRQAENASQAMALMTEAPASIMLCDVKMPGHNGLWLAEWVHEHYPQTAIIMATSADDIETVVTSRKIGAVGYVMKPFGKELLLQALRKANPDLGL